MYELPTARLFNVWSGYCFIWCFLRSASPWSIKHKNVVMCCRNEKIKKYKRNSETGGYVPIDAGAKNNFIVVSFAGKCASPIIVSITICPWTCMLENGGVDRGVARVGVWKLSTTAVLVKPERLASAFACHHSPLTLLSTVPPQYYLQLFWATCLINCISRYILLKLNKHYC